MRRLRPGAAALLICLLGIGESAAARKDTNPRAPKTGSNWRAELPSVEDPLSLRWKLRLAGHDSASADSSAKLVDFRFAFGVDYVLNPALRLNVSPILRLQSGSTHVPDSQGKPENKFYLQQAAAIWEPAPLLRIQAGALDQRALHTSLLMESQAFPAARASLILGHENATRLTLSAESALPTSTSLSTNTREREPTPTLQTLHARLEGRPAPRLEWSAAAGAFDFKNLPSAVAQESSLLGNTVDRVSDTESIFRHEYRGLEAEASVKIPLRRWFLSFDAAGLQNQGAPSGFNQATSAGGGVGYRWDARTDVRVGGRSFRIEPDAAVAAFAESGLGFTNRAGYALESSLSFERGRYELGVMGGESELIYVNHPQSRERFLRLKLETSYADF